MDESACLPSAVEKPILEEEVSLAAQNLPPLLVPKNTKQEEASRRLRISNKKRNSHSSNTCTNDWKSFQFQDHSLRISVSDIAACVGFHPFKSLVKLVMDHVYQGTDGQALLRHDSQLLGISLVSEEEALLQLAQQAGASTKQALEMALEVQTGQTKLDTIEEASRLKQKVIKEAQKSKKLSAAQLNQLQEGARHSIYTGFGTSWESQALDMYEQHCGWEVRDRNAEIRVWPFDKTTDNDDDEEGVPSVQAVQPAYACYRRRDASERESKRQKTLQNKEVVDLVASSSSSNSSGAEDETALKPPQMASNHQEDSSQRTDSSSTLQPPTFFFTMRGAIDGIREELVPSTTQGGDDDDDSWVLTKVIVECKHRMYKLQASPPLYEMIQTTAYCLMHQVQDADLVQVLREKKQKRRKRTHAGDKTKSTKENQKHNNDVNTKNQITNYLKEKSIEQDSNKEMSTAEKPQGSSNDDDALPVPNSKGEEQESKSLKDVAPIDSKPESSIPSNKENGVKERPQKSTNHGGPLSAANSIKGEHGSKASKDDPPLDSKVADDGSLPSFKSQEATSSNSRENVSVVTTKDTTNTDKVDEPSCDLKIVVHRISLEDPLLRHGYHWKSVILPRLRSWVESVYSIRRSDDNRYRLLTALASDRLQDAWQILFEECPWLRDCGDTSYLRDISSSC